MRSRKTPMTFVLAHLSDPHLAPLPQPRLVELARQARDRLRQLAAQARRRSTGRRCWRASSPISRRRRRTTSRSPAISSIWRCRSEYAAGARLARCARPAGRRDLGAGQSRRLCAQRRRRVARALGRLHARRRGGSRSDRLPVPAPARAAGADRAVDLGAEPAAHGDRPRRRRSARAPRTNPRATARREGLFRVVLIHHPPTSKRSHYLRRLTDGRALARRARAARRRAGDPRPQPSPPDRLARRTERAHSRGRRAVGVGSAARRARSRRLQSLSHRRRARRLALRGRSRAAAHGRRRGRDRTRDAAGGAR